MFSPQVPEGLSPGGPGRQGWWCDCTASWPARLGVQRGIAEPLCCLCRAVGQRSQGACNPWLCPCPIAREPLWPWIRAAGPAPRPFMPWPVAATLESSRGRVVHMSGGTSQPTAAEGKACDSSLPPGRQCNPWTAGHPTGGTQILNGKRHCAPESPAGTPGELLERNWLLKSCPLGPRLGRGSWKPGELH